MNPLTAQQIRLAVGGRALDAAAADLPPIAAVSTDSRSPAPKSLFIALKGDRFDGHAYLADAAAQGAIVALVQDKPANPPPGLHLILVPDTRLALGRLAKFVRQQMRAKVIGVAGSNGKTSTKSLIHAALSTKLRGTVSPKSFNNDIGVPLTLLPADPLQDYVVVEMGTNHPGEIRVLTQIAQPDIAVITSIAAEHLEFLIDVNGVRRENATIIEGLGPKGLLVVNGDDAALLAIFNKIYRGTKLTFGFERHNDLFAANVTCETAGTRFQLNGRLGVFVPMIGRHVASNALIAFAVGRKLGLTEEQIVLGLAAARGPEMRMELQEIGGITLLNDAYNANPGSMRAALETLQSLPTRSRRIAILGDMLELGAAGDAMHSEVGSFAARCQLDGLACVGERAALIAAAAEKSGMPAAAVSRFPDAAAAALAVPEWLRDGDLVLIKASRGIKLESVARAIADHRNGNHAPPRLAAS